MGCDICKYNDVLEYSKKNSNDPLWWYDNRILRFINVFIIENRILVAYIFFIFVYIVGIADVKFIYHFNIPLIKAPYMLAVLVSDLVILIIFFMLDIKLGSDCNELFDKMTDKLTIIRS